MINQLFFASQFSLTLLKSITQEQSKQGHYALVNQDLSVLIDYKTKIEQQQDEVNDVVVVGIGGSSLGARAIYGFLKTVRSFNRNLYFLDSTNPIDITHICQQITLSKTHFIIVSKSGTTIEVIAIYKYLAKLIKDENINHLCFSFISELHSPLIKHAKAIKATYLVIDKNISGRFSVLSAIGLAPLVLVGVDIKAVLLGAKSINDSFFNQGYIQENLLKKAYFYSNKSPYININTLFSYSQSLHYFNHWFIQLWGESLGKKQQHSNINVGLTPIGLIGPKDQHSFLQLLAEGKRDKSVTFIKLIESHQHIIPNQPLLALEDFDVLNNLSFSSLINIQADATIESLNAYGDIPIDVIELAQQDEHNIGELIMYFELLTSLVGLLMNINTYNQPGVQRTKDILNHKLKETFV